jgi:hypothetical protein
MIASRMIIVCEGLSEVHLLRKLMGRELTGDMKFYASQGRSSLVSLARNLIVHEGGPVFLVMDADSTNAHVREELEAITTVAMHGAASGGTFLAIPGLFKLFMFVPEIEAVFFEAPEVLERVTGKPISQDVVEGGLKAPAATLAKLTGNSKPVAVDLLSAKLDEKALDMLRKGKQALAFRMNIEELLRDAKVA